MDGTTGQTQAKRATLMIVDDDPAVLETLELALTWKGYDVVTAESGEAAASAARTVDVDLVLTDLRMGEMNGLQTMLAIKALKPNVRVMIVTGFASAAMEAELMEAGAYAIVTKPFALDDLFAAVRQALEADDGSGGDRLQ